jgi:hypothetical protein
MRRRTLHFSTVILEHGGHEVIHFGSTGCNDVHVEIPINKGFFIYGASGFLTIQAFGWLSARLPFDCKLLVVILLHPQKKYAPKWHGIGLFGRECLCLWVKNDKCQPSKKRKAR